MGGVEERETGRDVFYERRIYLEETKKKLSQSFKVGSISKPKGNCFAPTKKSLLDPQRKVGSNTLVADKTRLSLLLSETSLQVLGEEKEWTGPSVLCHHSLTPHYRVPALTLTEEHCSLIRSQPNLQIRAMAILFPHTWTSSLFIFNSHLLRHCLAILPQTRAAGSRQALNLSISSHSHFISQFICKTQIHGHSSFPLR